MSARDDDLLARVAWSQLAEPGDNELGQVLAAHGAAEALRLLRAGRLRGRNARHWAVRLPGANPGRDLDLLDGLGGRVVCPGDPEWPTQLDSLADGAPYMLWVRGQADLRFSCLRSVAIVGARAATGYGTHVAGQIAYDLGGRGWTVVSGGAYGIDGTSHRAALGAGGTTVAVLACGIDVPYPSGHTDLFDEVAAGGVLVSEWPPGSRPSRFRFLIRNRVIAALTRGTVVVEAALRSGALNTARHAAWLDRPVMAVPGPVTSTMSGGCHLLLRDLGATCVTDAADVIDRVGTLGDDLAPERRGPVLPRDRLDQTASRVLDALPSRGGAGPATISVAAGVDLDETLRCLGRLAAGGFVERCSKGWRVGRLARDAPAGPSAPAEGGRVRGPGEGAARGRTRHEGQGGHGGEGDTGDTGGTGT
ncbi:MAG: DNA-processing protein DprA [Streptosporangiaceae bacterium]